MDYSKKWSLDWIYLNDIPCISIWSEQCINEWYICIDHSTDILTIKSNQRQPLEIILYFVLMSNLRSMRDSICFKFPILIDKIRANRLCSRILKNNMSSFCQSYLTRGRKLIKN